jgi:hypothetical protein
MVTTYNFLRKTVSIYNLFFYFQLWRAPVGQHPYSKNTNRGEYKTQNIIKPDKNTIKHSPQNGISDEPFKASAAPPTANRHQCDAYRGGNDSQYAGLE